MNLVERFPHPDKSAVAMVVQDQETTYGQLVDRVARWRGALIDHGLRPGATVGLLAGNSDAFVVGYLAVLSAGLIAVPLNPQSPPAELVRELEAVSCEAMIVGPFGVATWSQIDAASLGIKHVFHADDGVLDAGQATAIVPVERDAIACLLFTSGTAGSPKAAMLTHGNLWASLVSMISAQPHIRDEPQVALAVIPLFHVFGLSVVINLSMFLGSKMVLANYEAPARTAELVRLHGVTQLAGPPALWRALLDEPGLVPADFVTLSRAISGAAKLDPSIALGLRDRLAIDLREGYGLTETCATVTSSIGTDAPLGSVGLIMPGVEARIVDEDGDDVLVGDTGELIVYGDMLSPGYWQDEEATAQTRTADGWLKTGDLANVDDDGFISIVDRVKDLIIVSGFNVHPGEVESVLNHDPSVAEAGVIGIADPATGEAIVAYVVPAEGHVIDQAQLLNACAEQLARYKVPRRIVSVSELPKTSVGKIRRRDLDRNISDQ
ncbi:MAG: AMP-binding protein [Acidimicrobiales bacterium]